MKTQIPILGFSAWSGVGKTTLLEKLIPALVAVNIHVGLVKHAHHNFDIDKPGKDSHRLRKAGANPVLIISDRRMALMQEAEDENQPVTLAEALAALPAKSTYDLLLVEGFKAANIPKIILHRPMSGQHTDLPIPLTDPNVIALATDKLSEFKARYPQAETPLLDLNELESIVNFIQQWLAGNTQRKGNQQAHGLSFNEGLAAVLQSVEAINETEILALGEASGRILATPMTAKIAVPSDDNSAMDGYACRFEDLSPQAEPRLRLIGTSACGLPFAKAVAKGHCVRVLTGAVIPAGCDTVVMQEQCQLDGEYVRFKLNPDRCLRKMQHIRLVGEDIARNSKVADTGQALEPALLGVLASAGIMEVTVRRRPRVAFITNGNELVPLGQRLSAGQCHDSNRYTLQALLNRAGVEVQDLGIVGDDQDELSEAIAKANEQADLVLSTGGISVGDADFVKPVMRNLGEIIFSGLKIKPGHPVTLAKLPDSLFFGLPGNPVAVMVCFDQLVRPAIEALMGSTQQQAIVVEARAQEDLRKLPGRYEFMRGLLSQDKEGHFLVQRAGKQGSAILSTMARANCYILLDEQCAGITQGQWVRVQPF